VPIFKLFAWVRALDERTLSVAQLANLVIAPEYEGSIVERSHAMPSAALQVIDHQRVISFVKEV